MGKSYQRGVEKYNKTRMFVHFSLNFLNATAHMEPFDRSIHKMPEVAKFHSDSVKFTSFTKGGSISECFRSHSDKLDEWDRFLKPASRCPAQPRS